MPSMNITTDKTLTTLIQNGRLNTDTSGWTMSTAVSSQIVDGDFLRITSNTASSTGTYPNSQLFSSVKGNTAATRQILYVTAKVRAMASNSTTSKPRVYVSYYPNGSTSTSFSNLTSQEGLEDTELNDGKWHTLSIHLQTYSVATGNSFEYYRVAFGVETPAVGDTLDVKDIMVFNLTEAFGRGNEPTKSWCDKNIVDFAETYVFPVTTSVEMITDRTQSDVSRWRELHDKGFAAMSDEERHEWLFSSKGSYNYTDMNRVETAVQYVASRLRDTGFVVDPIVKTTWEVNEIPSRNDMNRYYNNVAELREIIPVYPTTPESPTIEQKLSHREANALEQILFDIDELLTKIQQACFYSGEIYAMEVTDGY